MGKNAKLHLNNTTHCEALWPALLQRGQEDWPVFKKWCPKGETWLDLLTRQRPHKHCLGNKDTATLKTKQFKCEYLKYSHLKFTYEDEYRPLVLTEGKRMQNTFCPLYTYGVFFLCLIKENTLWITLQTIDRLSPKYAKINFIATFDEQKILTTEEYSANKWDVTKAADLQRWTWSKFQILEHSVNISNAFLNLVVKRWASSEIAKKKRFNTEKLKCISKILNICSHQRRKLYGAGSTK